MYTTGKHPKTEQWDDLDITDMYFYHRKGHFAYKSIGVAELPLPILQYLVVELWDHEMFDDQPPQIRKRGFMPFKILVYMIYPIGLVVSTRQERIF